MLIKRVSKVDLCQLCCHKNINSDYYLSETEAVKGMKLFFLGPVPILNFVPIPFAQNEKICCTLPTVYVTNKVYFIFKKALNASGCRIAVHKSVIKMQLRHYLT